MLDRRQPPPRSGTPRREVPGEGSPGAPAMHSGATDRWRGGIMGTVGRFKEEPYPLGQSRGMAQAAEGGAGGNPGVPLGKAW